MKLYFFVSKFLSDSSKNKDDISNYRESVEKFYYFKGLKENKAGII